MTTSNCDDAIVSSPTPSNRAAEISPVTTTPTIVNHTVPALITLATKSILDDFISLHLPSSRSEVDTLVTSPICQTPANQVLTDHDFPTTPPPHVSPSAMDVSEYLEIPFEDIAFPHTQPSVAAQHIHPTVAALTPEMVKPFPKAPPRTESRRGRKKGKSRIITDTPEKAEIEAAYLERLARLKQKKPVVKSLKRKKQPKKKAAKRKVKIHPLRKTLTQN